MALQILAVRLIPAERPPHPDLLPARGEKEQSHKRLDAGLRRRRLLVKDGYRGMGDFYQCVMGQVSEDRGGNPTA